MHVHINVNSMFNGETKFRFKKKVEIKSKK